MFCFKAHEVKFKKITLADIMDTSTFQNMYNLILNDIKKKERSLLI